MHETVRVTAPAKVNLFLSIGDTRPDGYHDVTTITQTITLGDVVTIDIADELQIACTTDLGVSAEENLAHQAARAFGEVAGGEPRVRIELAKEIPPGAGLGGGSSNAAAVIAGLASLWGIPADDERLLTAAATVGADVPLFLFGGASHMEGRGDVLAARLETPACALALVRPPDGVVSTADAYRAFDAAPPEARISPARMLEAYASGSCAAIAEALHNNMTAPSVGLVPEIADAIAWASDAEESLGVVMAGSGAAVCAICTDDGGAAALAERARSDGWWARAARTSDSGVHVAEGGRS
jgi:4-diphosphocytidyl-2-C-methyl-D-erythritol kinase